MRRFGQARAARNRQRSKRQPRSSASTRSVSPRSRSISVLVEPALDGQGNDLTAEVQLRQRIDDARHAVQLQVGGVLRAHAQHGHARGTSGLHAVGRIFDGQAAVGGDAQALARRADRSAGSGLPRSTSSPATTTSNASARPSERSVASTQRGATTTPPPDASPSSRARADQRDDARLRARAAAQDAQQRVVVAGDVFGYRCRAGRGGR